MNVYTKKISFMFSLRRVMLNLKVIFKYNISRKTKIIKVKEVANDMKIDRFVIFFVLVAIVFFALFILGLNPDFPIHDITITEDGSITLTGISELLFSGVFFIVAIIKAWKGD
jgi:hypothetical protein